MVQRVSSITYEEQKQRMQDALIMLKRIRHAELRLPKHMDCELCGYRTLCKPCIRCGRYTCLECRLPVDYTSYICGECYLELLKRIEGE